jgi:hypothetical protein
MSRSGIRTIVTVALAGYGVYVASYLPAMLPGPATPGLVALFAIQTFCAIAAAVGVWRRRRWASDTVVALGVAIATTSVIEGFVLGIVPYLRVLVVAVAAIAVTFVVAAYLNSVPTPWVTSSSNRRLRSSRS